jgi:hypothetical protein
MQVSLMRNPIRRHNEHRRRKRERLRDVVHRIEKGLVAAVGQHHGELVAAEPARHAAGPVSDKDELRGDMAQKRVARVVPVLVVDLFEPSQVQHQRRRPSPSLGEGGVSLVQPAPVRQASELVVRPEGIVGSPTWVGDEVWSVG